MLAIAGLRERSIHLGGGVRQANFKVVQGIRGNAWNSKEGATVSRAFRIKSVNVISLTTVSPWSVRVERRMCKSGREMYQSVHPRC